MAAVSKDSTEIRFREIQLGKPHCFLPSNQSRMEGNSMGLRTLRSKPYITVIISPLQKGPPEATKPGIGMPAKLEPGGERQKR